jgi:putative DNA primase/helicase
MLHSDATNGKSESCDTSWDEGLTIYEWLEKYRDEDEYQLDEDGNVVEPEWLEYQLDEEISHKESEEISHKESEQINTETSEESNKEPPRQTDPSGYELPPWLRKPPGNRFPMWPILNLGEQKDFPREAAHARLSRLLYHQQGIVPDIARMLCDYLLIDPDTVAMVAGWTLASHFIEAFNQYPVLAITAPEMRCGKTSLLFLLHGMCPRSIYSEDSTYSALTRSIGDTGKPTLLFDEAETANQKSDETDRRKFYRCLVGSYKKGAQRMVTERVKDRFQPYTYSTFSAKAVALIGRLPPVLADRCFEVRMQRRLAKEKKFDEPEITTAVDLGEKIVGWGDRHKAKVEKAYAEIKSFALNNERLASLLRPLQAVLKVDADNGGSPLALNMLGSWAHRMDAASSGPEKQSMGTRLLHACQEIFQEKKKAFLATVDLIDGLVELEGEPWAEYSANRKISPHALRDLLEPYGIQPDRQGSPKKRGYTRAKIDAACSRYR